MKALWIIVVAVLISPFAYSAFRSDWKGVLKSKNHYYLMDLEPSPIWDPPASPSYVAFKSKYQELPNDTDSIIYVDQDWGSTFLNGAFGLWAVSAILGIVHVLVRRKHRESALVLASWLFVSTSVAALMCLQLYLLLGGWGAPFPAAFALAGIVGGISLFIRQRSVQSKAPTAP